MTTLRSCCIPNCKSSGFKDGEKLCSFPQQEDKKQIWVACIRQSGCVPETWEPTESSFVCQVHFEKSCFVTDAETQTQKMTRGSVPTIFTIGDPNSGKKHTVSIIQTRRAVGITPKARSFYDADPSPTTRQKKDPQPGLTFKPVITRTLASDKSEASVTNSPTKTTSVVVIASEPKSTLKRVISTSSNHPASKKAALSSCGNCAQMQEKLNQKTSTIRELEIHITELKQELSRQDSTRKAASSKIDRLKESLKEIYTDHQLARLSDGTTRGRPWDLETTRRAAKLVLACGRNGYQELLNQGQPFPSLKTLNRLLYKRRYLNSTIENPDPTIAMELREEMSETDPEDESEGSAEEIEENIISGEEGRILKKSRRTRKLRNAMQRSLQNAQIGRTLQTMETNETAILEGVESIAEGQLLLQQMDQLNEEEDADGQALISQYGQIQDSTTAPITGDLIESILSAQNLTADDVHEIKFDGTYVTIIKKQDALTEEDPSLMSHGIIG